MNTISYIEKNKKMCLPCMIGYFIMYVLKFEGVRCLFLEFLNTAYKITMEALIGFLFCCSRNSENLLKLFFQTDNIRRKERMCSISERQQFVAAGGISHC